jgi:ABC-type Na+ transport system ATPase subunit NatA
MYYVVATMFPTSRLVKTIVEEKETRMRETMKIMGLEDWAHQLSWLITAFILFTWIGISTTYIAKISFLPMSDTSLVFIFFMLFAMSEMALCFLVSVFFKNAKIAAVCAPVILLFLLLPKYIFFGTGDESNVSRKALASFLSPTAFAFGADIAANYEYGNVGLQYSNLHAPGYNFYTVLTMLFVDTVLYGILAWYFDQTLSSQYGRPRGWLFFLNPSYWCGRMWRKKDKEAGDAAISTQTPAAEALDPDIEPFTDLQRRALAVVVSGLRKQYSDGKLALKHLDLALVEGEITCLLGHNGAGKSTTISLLTGLYAATAGDVSIYGHSLSDELDAIRKTTGICPQMDVLFPSLTVKEHLHFFGAIKGLKRGVLSDAVDEIMADIGLTEKALTLSGGLSGGMKRKLCLAMALIGDPKFVVMDEPTSGMDPYSRRYVSTALMKYA